MHVQVLGGFTVRLGDQTEAEWSTRRAAELVQLLALSRRAPAPARAGHRRAVADPRPRGGRRQPAQGGPPRAARAGSDRGRAPAGRPGGAASARRSTPMPSRQRPTRPCRGAETAARPQPSTPATCCRSLPTRRGRRLRAPGCATSRASCCAARSSGSACSSTTPPTSPATGADACRAGRRPPAGRDPLVRPAAHGAAA